MPSGWSRARISSGQGSFWKACIQDVQAVEQIVGDSDGQHRRGSIGRAKVGHSRGGKGRAA
eukprot:1153494-Pelagomonas_calceolata.AAC.3